MKKNYIVSFNINKFLQDIKLKKKYIKNFKSNTLLLSNIKKNNYKIINNEIFLNKLLRNHSDNLIMYIVDISFSRSNTLLNVSDFYGNLIFARSAGFFNYSGKSKRSRWVILKEFYRSLLKLKYLKNKPVAIHLKNIGSSKFWIIKKLKKILFIKIIRSFTFYPHNGCRKRKLRRRKFKKS